MNPAPAMRAPSPRTAVPRPARRGARIAHADSRLPQLFDAAARLFCEQGYLGTTVRDIAGEAGMLPGSLYCHFATKEDLLVAVYMRGVDRVCDAVRAAIERIDDPWRRLEAACVSHLETILRDDDYARVVVRVRPADVPAVSARLAAERDRYEVLWRALVDDLDLPPRDRQTIRLMLLGALNWAQTWYRAEGRASPRAWARRFVRLIEPRSRSGVGRHAPRPETRR